MAKAPHIYQRPLRAEFAAVIFDYLFDMFTPRKKPEYNQSSSLDPGLLECVWIGHATFLINMYGRHILTDPMFSNRALIALRKVSPSLRIKQLPLIDAVLLSHSHFDHMDKKSLKQLDRTLHNCTFIVPEGYGRYLHWMRNPVQELHHGKTVHFHGVKLQAHAPKHMTCRYPWQKFHTLNAYTMQCNGQKVFFAGDTAYEPNIHERFCTNPDVALLPIGAYDPPILEEVHQTPEQALQLAANMGAKHVIPMHFETFRLSFENIKEPRERFIQAAQQYPELSTYPIEIGQKVVFSPKQSKGVIY